MELIKDRSPRICRRAKPILWHSLETQFRLSRSLPHPAAPRAAPSSMHDASCLSRLHPIARLAEKKSDSEHRDSSPACQFGSLSQAPGRLTLVSQSGCWPSSSSLGAVSPVSPPPAPGQLSPGGASAIRTRSAGCPLLPATSGPPRP